MKEDVVAIPFVLEHEGKCSERLLRRIGMIRKEPVIQRFKMIIIVIINKLYVDEA